MYARDLFAILLRATGLLLILFLFEALPIRMCYLVVHNTLISGSLSYLTSPGPNSWFAIWASSYLLLCLLGAGALILFARRIDACLNGRPPNRPAQSERIGRTRIDVLAALIRLLGAYGVITTIEQVEELITSFAGGANAFGMTLLLGIRFLILATLSFFFLFRAGHIGTWLETRPWDTVANPEDDDAREGRARASG